MKIINYILIFTCFLILEQKSNFVFASTQDQNPCADRRGLAQKCNAWGCSQVTRVDILCRIKRYFQEYYAPLALKQTRIKLKPIKHLNQCIRKEKVNKDNDQVKFYERTRKCLAALQDGHIGFFYHHAPFIEAGIRVKEIHGSFYLTSLRPDLVYKAGYTNTVIKIKNNFKLGVKILAINDIPIQKVRDALLPYAFGSSLAARKKNATDLLFRRNFLFPQKSLLKITFINLKTSIYRNWYYYFRENMENKKLANKLLKLGFLSLNQSGKQPYIFKKINGKLKLIDFGKKWIGYKNDRLLPVLTKPENTKKPSNTWTRSQTKIKITEKSFFENYSQNQLFNKDLSFILNNEKKVCYAKLFSFSYPEALHTATRTSNNPLYHYEKTHNIFKEWKKFLEACQLSGYPLVIDIRNNPGGNGRYPFRFFKYLVNKNKMLSALLTFFEGFRVTNKTEELVQNFQNNPNLLPFVDNEAITLLKKLKQKKKNVQSNPKLLPYVTYQPQSFQKLKGTGTFLGKVFVLTSANCVSACDEFAALFKESKRGVLIGTATHGTGAGFMGRGFSHFDLKTIRICLLIPNFLFGISGIRKYFSNVIVNKLFSKTLKKSIYQGNPMYYLGNPLNWFQALKNQIPKYPLPEITVNTPIQPDIVYHPSLKDYLGNGSGWWNMIKKQLKKNKEIEKVQKEKN